MAHIDLDKKILDKSERFAQENRELLDAHGVFMIDLLASPGAGKTSTIKATINALRELMGLERQNYFMMPSAFRPLYIGATASPSSKATSPATSTPCASRRWASRPSRSTPAAAATSRAT